MYAYDLCRSEKWFNLIESSDVFSTSNVRRIYTYVYILVTDPALVVEVFREREGKICYKWLVIVAI